MRLIEFRVENYKKIRDTGWTKCGDLTCFVGKNEAGKSALFRCLSKINPSDGAKLDGLKEFPRRRFSDEFTTRDWAGPSARFALSEWERKQIQAKCGALGGVERVEVTRHYSGKLTALFDPVPKLPSTSRDRFKAGIERAIKDIQALVAPEGKGEALGALKQAVGTALLTVKTQAAQTTALTKAEVETAVAAIANHSNEAWQQELLNPVVEPFRQLSADFDLMEQVKQAQEWAVAHLPKFIYFDNYDVLRSAIHIPTFANQLATTPNAPGVRTTHCLFKHVGLDIAKLQSLGQHSPGAGENATIARQVDERSIRAHSAALAMTARFESWWEQRRHKFDYRTDGEYFRVWVSDDLDPSEIELDQRSQGMQYFFCFYLVFLTEVEDAHDNSILLLDEPGLSLHGTAQAKLIEFLEKLSKDNQTLYSTHSPFMIDGKHLERARAVYEQADGTTTVSEDVWPRDKDTLFPLQAALGYSLAQGLFYSDRQVIVEGLADYWLLNAVSLALEYHGKAGLRRDVALVPSAGVTKLLPLASMLVGHGVTVAAVLDGDEPGRREGQKLTKKLLDGEDRRCLFVGDFTANANAEIEDLFPEAYYLESVHAIHPTIAPLAFTADEATLPAIVDRIEAAFLRLGAGEFHKFKTAAHLRDRVLADPANVPAATLAVAEQLIAKLNGLFG